LVNKNDSGYDSRTEFNEGKTHQNKLHKNHMEAELVRTPDCKR
jgi:hypothetical protein